MKNREIIATLNGLYALRERENKREKPDKVFTGRILFAMSRNLRTLEKEYNENYVKDLQGIREKYYVAKEEDVTVPANEHDGTEEHTEKRRIEVLKPGCSEDEYMKELNELLDIQVDLNITKVPCSDLDKVYDFKDMDAIEFMVE